MATDFDWTGFRALAKRLDTLVEADRDDAEFAEELRRAVTFIYTAGITMPSAGDIFEDAGGAEFWDGRAGGALSSGLEGAGVISATEMLAERIAESAESAQPDEIGDPEEITEVATTAAENLLAVTVALAEGSALFDAKRLNEAAWEWSFGFDEWGTNALAALGALHELLWGTR